MAEMTLTKTAIVGGRWHGVLAGADATPDLALVHLERPIDGLEVTERADGTGWDVAVAIPTDLLSDGVQTLMITDRATGEKLASFALMAGEAMADDIRAEIDLLRAELDMLKRAFRRHCLETM